MTRHASLAARCASFVLAILPLAAFAHLGQGDLHGGLQAGLLHPVSGLDHVIAMIAVGIWGAQLGAPAMWALPVCFPLVMALGGALGAAGVPLPGIEIGIALSGVALGAMVAFAARPPLWAALTLVGVFAIFHGHAHGAELPPGSDAVAYSVGFVVATGMLHVCGILCGLAHRSRLGARALRLAGTMIASGGCYFLVAHFAGA